MKKMYVDIETLKGIIYAGGGITLSEIEILEGWVGLLIKVIAFAVIVVHFFRTFNNWKQQRINIMRPDQGDNESGSGSDIDPDGDD